MLMLSFVDGCDEGGVDRLVNPSIFYFLCGAAYTTIQPRLLFRPWLVSAFRYINKLWLKTEFYSVRYPQAATQRSLLDDS